MCPLVKTATLRTFLRYAEARAPAYRVGVDEKVVEVDEVCEHGGDVGRIVVQLTDGVAE